jgi:hypothetical protein
MIYMLVNSITYAPLAVPPAGLFFWLLPGLALKIQEDAGKLKAAEAGSGPVNH